MVFRWTGNGRGNGVSRAAYARAGEQTLVKGLRQGDPDAFAALFELYRSRIYNFVARIVGDPEDAKDITQDVFIKAFRQIPGNGKDLALKPWLYRVATTTSLDHLRSRRRRADTSPIACDDLPATGDAFEQLEMNGLVQDTLERLSDRHRLILVLKDLHGLRHDEIAQILGVSRGATETLLFRARAAFRRAFLNPAPVASDTRRRCPQTRRAALAFIAADASPDERRRVLEHSHTCRDCRSVVRRSKNASFGLALFLPQLEAPAGFDWNTIAGGVGAVGGAAGAAAVTGALAKIGSAVSAKAAAIAAAAVVAVTGAGMVAEIQLTQHGPSESKAAARGPVAAHPHSSPTPRWAAREAADAHGGGVVAGDHRGGRDNERAKRDTPAKPADRNDKTASPAVAAQPASGGSQVAANAPPSPSGGTTTGSSGGQGDGTHIGAQPSGGGDTGPAPGVARVKPPPKHKTSPKGHR